MEVRPPVSYTQYATDSKNLIIMSLRLRFKRGKIMWPLCTENSVEHTLSWHMNVSLARSKRFLTSVVYCTCQYHVVSYQIWLGAVLPPTRLSVCPMPVSQRLQCHRCSGLCFASTAVSIMTNLSNWHLLVFYEQVADEVGRNTFRKEIAGPEFCLGKTPAT